LWVHHHTTQQSTQDIPPPINQTPTTTNNHKHHHYHHHSPSLPPTPNTPSQPTTPPKHAQPSLAPARPASRPPARLRPSGCTLGNIASQPASQPECQPAANGQRAAGLKASQTPPVAPATQSLTSWPHRSEYSERASLARSRNYWITSSV
jgi:hypothetical protein